MAIHLLSRNLLLLQYLLAEVNARESVVWSTIDERNNGAYKIVGSPLIPPFNEALYVPIL